MTQEQLQSIGCTIIDDSYTNYHNGNHEQQWEIKSERLEEGFNVYQPLEKLDFKEIKKREISAYARQLFKSHEDLLEKQLMPTYLKIAKGTKEKKLTTTIKIPTK